MKDLEIGLRDFAISKVLNVICDCQTSTFEAYFAVFVSISGIQDECKLRPFEWTGDTITKDCEVTEFERSIQKVLVR